MRPALCDELLARSPSPIAALDRDAINYLYEQN
jgi:hypothetical protein